MLRARGVRACAAFATLGYHPSGNLLDRLGHHAAGIIRTFRPQATSNALWCKPLCLLLL